MKFVHEGIGELVLKELGKATECRLAVAFFNPDEKMLNALSRLGSKLSLVISEEFTISNPYKIEQLKKAKVRSVPPDDANGKLHAKVLIMKRVDASCWVLLGSANLTHPGMFSNQEACVVMESGRTGEEQPVAEIRDWFDALFDRAKVPDLKQAKLIFDARSHYVLIPRPKSPVAKEAGYWALKTTSGATGKQHWPSFVADSAVAVGWSDIPIDPSQVSDEKLRGAIRKTYPDDDVPGAAAKIRKFVEMKEGDIVLVCRGYSPQQTTDVHIHGLARVTGPFRVDHRPKWDWKFKHDAVIQVVNMDLPKKTVAVALGKDSLMQTIHQLDAAGFDRLAVELKERGVQVEV